MMNGIPTGGLNDEWYFSGIPKLVSGEGLL